jgi:hypothetical protein
VKGDRQAVLLSRSLFEGDALSNNPLLCLGTSATQRLAALLWHQKRDANIYEYTYGDAVGYFNAWPDNFYKELDDVTAVAEVKLIDLFNRTAFKYIYSDLILHSQCLLPEDEAPHFIYLTLMDYLYRLVESHPKSKKPNVADMLVSVAETAVLLSTTHEQVYRLYQDGVLFAAFGKKLQQRIDPYIGVFYLRQVIEYKASFGGDSFGNNKLTWPTN